MYRKDSTVCFVHKEKNTQKCDCVFEILLLANERALSTQEAFLLSYTYVNFYRHLNPFLMLIMREIRLRKGPEVLYVLR